MGGVLEEDFDVSQAVIFFDLAIIMVYGAVFRVSKMWASSEKNVKSLIQPLNDTNNTLTYARSNASSKCLANNILGKQSSQITTTDREKVNEMREFYFGTKGHLERSEENLRAMTDLITDAIIGAGTERSVRQGKLE